MSAVKSTGIPALLTLPAELTNEIIRDVIAPSSTHIEVLISSS